MTTVITPPSPSATKTISAHIRLTMTSLRERQRLYETRAGKLVEELGVTNRAIRVSATTTLGAVGNVLFINGLHPVLVDLTVGSDTITVLTSFMLQYATYDNVAIRPNPAHPVGALPAEIIAIYG